MTRSSLATSEVAARAEALARLFDEDSDWAELRQHTRPKDLRDVADMCQRINPDRWQELYVCFFDQVLDRVHNKPRAVQERDDNLPRDWFHQPFYYAYVQYFGATSVDDGANFDDLIGMLDYLERAGIQNLFLLPHYASPLGDSGYDVSDYSPRQDLGGPAAFDRFMATTVARDFRVVTDLPINHTSIEHRWFKQALAGNRDKLAYYLRRDGREKTGEVERDGDLYAVYKDPDGRISERLIIFPDIERSHEARYEIDGRQVSFYREFYPFEVDLDLQQPEVIEEILLLLGAELHAGVLGKRTDAVAHWIKRPGTRADGLAETHALHALLKSFIRHLSPRAIVMPEAVRGLTACAPYAGMATEIAGQVCASEGDALLSFEMQAVLREMSYAGSSAPFWNKVFTIPKLPADAVWLNLLEHHDETYLGLISPRNRERVASLIETSGGVRYKNGMSAGGRLADVLDHDPQRLACAVFCLYMLPGVPVMYYGTEIGAGNQHLHARAMVVSQQAILREQGVDVPVERCFDPRELQRGVIPAEDFLHAQGEQCEPYQTWAQLNLLRAQHSSLRSALLTPIDNGHDSVLCLVKFSEDHVDQAMLAIANLDPQSKQLSLPADQLLRALGVEADAAPAFQALLRSPQLDPAWASAELPLRIDVGAGLQLDLPGSAFALLVAI